MEEGRKTKKSRFVILLIFSFNMDSEGSGKKG